MPQRGSMAGRPRRRSPLWARVALIFGLVLAVTSGLTLAGGKLLLARYTGQVNQAPLLGGAAAKQHSISGPINMLLVGIDERQIANPADGARADSIIILHIPASHDRAYMVSIPRDTRVQIPAFPATKYPGDTQKINAAFNAGFQNKGGRNGGFQLLALTLQKLTGLKFSGGAIVNFDGFRSIVDAVGGVDMCVDEKVTSIHIGWNIKTGKEGVPYKLSAPAYNDPHLIPGMRPQVYEVGCQHFNGWQALDYARQRDLLANQDGDYGRQRHQQQFIKAMAKKVSSAGLANPLKLDGILRAAGAAVTFDGNKVSLTDWVFTLKDLNPANIVTIKTNGGQFHSQVIGGQDVETLDTTTTQLFPALVSDQVDAYLAAHPEIVATTT
jgi:LCP family protein required for cell wall assembly